MATSNTQPSTFVVISWNVLHMIHEINYVSDLSPVIERYSIKEDYSNEKRRLNDMLQTISDLLSKYSTMECFVCLQEVPNDLLPMLNQMFDGHVGSKPVLHIQTYSRQPRINGSQRYILYADPRESLVTIHYNPQSNSIQDRVHWTPCPSDHGKGALSITTDSNITVVNVHVPFNDTAISLLSDIQWPNNDSKFVMVGDMNRYSERLMEMINNITRNKPSLSELFPIPTNKPTRVSYNQNRIRQKKWIDYHVVSASLKDSANSPAIVHDEIGDVSDHYPIILTFQSS